MQYISAFVALGNGFKICTKSWLTLSLKILCTCVTEIGTHGGERYSCTLLYLCVGS